MRSVTRQSIFALGASFMATLACRPRTTPSGNRTDAATPVRGVPSPECLALCERMVACERNLHAMGFDVRPAEEDCSRACDAGGSYVGVTRESLACSDQPECLDVAACVQRTGSTPRPFGYPPTFPLIPGGLGQSDTPMHMPDGRFASQVRYHVAGAALASQLHAALASAGWTERAAEIDATTGATLAYEASAPGWTIRYRLLAGVTAIDSVLRVDGTRFDTPEVPYLADFPRVPGAETPEHPGAGLHDATVVYHAPAPAIDLALRALLVRNGWRIQAVAWVPTSCTGFDATRGTRAVAVTLCQGSTLTQLHLRERSLPP